MMMLIALSAAVARWDVVVPPWNDCIEREARAMAVRSKEPAETIARATLSRCKVEEHAVEQELRRIMAGAINPSEEVRVRMQGARESQADKAIAIVIETRTATTKR